MQALFLNGNFSKPQLSFIGCFHHSILEILPCFIAKTLKFYKQSICAFQVTEVFHLLEISLYIAYTSKQFRVFLIKYLHPDQSFSRNIYTLLCFKLNSWANAQIQIILQRIAFTISLHDIISLTIPFDIWVLQMMP